MSSVSSLSSSAFVQILGRHNGRVVNRGLQPDLLGQHDGQMRVLASHQLRRHPGRQRAACGARECLCFSNSIIIYFSRNGKNQKYSSIEVCSFPSFSTCHSSSAICPPWASAPRFQTIRLSLRRSLSVARRRLPLRVLLLACEMMIDLVSKLEHFVFLNITPTFEISSASPWRSP